MKQKRPLRAAVLVDIEYWIPITLNIGESFFVPCLQRRITFNALEREYEPQKYKLQYQFRIEAGLYGFRVWRVG